MSQKAADTRSYNNVGRASFEVKMLLMYAVSATVGTKGEKKDN